MTAEKQQGHTPGPTRTLEIRCIDCRKDFVVIVNEQEYRRWINGELIQNAMPKLPEDERELLISNTCSKCFDALFDEDGVA